jgi:hypothetical protein
MLTVMLYASQSQERDNVGSVILVCIVCDWLPDGDRRELTIRARVICGYVTPDGTKVSRGLLRSL